MTVCLGLSVSCFWFWSNGNDTSILEFGLCSDSLFSGGLVEVIGNDDYHLSCFLCCGPYSTVEAEVIGGADMLIFFAAFSGTKSALSPTHHNS